MKIGLLSLLWGLFFSGSHQCRVDGTATASRFGMPNPAAQFVPARRSGGDHCD